MTTEEVVSDVAGHLVGFSERLHVVIGTPALSLAEATEAASNAASTAVLLGLARNWLRVWGLALGEEASGEEAEPVPCCPYDDIPF